jgi:hypothetical protein
MILSQKHLLRKGMVRSFSGALRRGKILEFGPVLHPADGFRDGRPLNVSEIIVHSFTHVNFPASLFWTYPLC